MELTKTNIHRKRQKEQVINQVTLDEDVIVPDTKAVILAIFKIPLVDLVAVWIVQDTKAVTFAVFKLPLIYVLRATLGQLAFSVIFKILDLPYVNVAVAHLTFVIANGLIVLVLAGVAMRIMKDRASFAVTLSVLESPLKERGIIVIVKFPLSVKFAVFEGALIAVTV